MVALVALVSTAWAHVRVLHAEPVDDDERPDPVDA
jgi:methionine-rich copper-binding protein CopC